jgi:hypothetical protein
VFPRLEKVFQTLQALQRSSETDLIGRMPRLVHHSTGRLELRMCAAKAKQGSDCVESKASDENVRQRLTSFMDVFLCFPQALQECRIGCCIMLSRKALSRKFKFLDIESQATRQSKNVFTSHSPQVQRANYSRNLYRMGWLRI